MRISDWSSDVCSSDLDVAVGAHRRRGGQFRKRARAAEQQDRRDRQQDQPRDDREPPVDRYQPRRRRDRPRPGTERGRQRDQPAETPPLLVGEDRKSGVWGKRVSVRVSLGGGRVLKKKTTD